MTYNNNNDIDNIIKKETLQSAVDKAISLNPDVVLLSPACASFDCFSGYEERGNVFKKVVEEIAENENKKCKIFNILQIQNIVSFKICIIKTQITNTIKLRTFLYYIVF